MHTKGEWDVAIINGGEYEEVVSEVGGCVVCIASIFGPCVYSEATPNGEDEPTYEVSDKEAKANARLIAAVPNLLAAAEEALLCLERVCRQQGTDPQTDLECQMLRAAIAKARGE